jgi:hypothetical protein
LDAIDAGDVPELQGADSVVSAADHDSVGELAVWQVQLVAGRECEAPPGARICRRPIGVAFGRVGVEAVPYCAGHADVDWGIRHRPGCSLSILRTGPLDRAMWVQVPALWI